MTQKHKSKQMSLEHSAHRLSGHWVATNLQFIKITVSAKHNKSKRSKMRSVCTLDSPSVAFSGCGRAEWSARRGLGLSGRAESPLVGVEAGAETQPQVGGGVLSGQSLIATGAAARVRQQGYQ